MTSNVFLYSGQDKSEVPRNITHVRCDESVTEIPESLFIQCQYLVTVELNEGLKRIGEFAFYFCTSLTSINFPSTLEVIGDTTFHWCEDLVNVDLNEGLKVIGGYTFNSCYSLRRINFPSTLEEIGDCAFHDCHNLESLDLPNGLEVIGKGAFYKCKSLKRLFVPSTVKRIKKEAFGRCLKLESVELPEDLEEIGKGAFLACDKLRNVSIPSTVTKFERLFTHEEDEDEGYDFEETRAPRHLASLFSEDDEDCTLLINAFKTRFHNLPIHELCYYQAHHPTAATLQSLQHTVKSQGISLDRCDVFGMSPFNILALSTKPNLDLFQALLKYYPAKFLTQKDVSGCCSIEYLLEHQKSEVNSMVKQLLVDRIKWVGLERWRNIVMSEIQNFPEGFESLNERKLQLDVIYFTLAKYERLEVLSLLEEFLWSMKLDEAKSTETDLFCREQRKKKKAKIHDDSNKQAYRVNCGADIIIPNVLLFLGDESATSEGDDDSSSTSPGSESEGDY